MSVGYDKLKTERILFAKQQLTIVLTELEIWLDEAREDAFCQDLLDFSLPAAGLAAILGFLRPPFEQIRKVSHEAYSALTDVREQAKCMIIYAHAPEGVGSFSFGLDGNLTDHLLSQCEPRLHADLHARVRRWKRSVDRVDPAIIRPAPTTLVINEYNSFEGLIFVTQLDREISGIGGSFYHDFLTHIGENYRLANLYRLSPEQTRQLLKQAGRIASSAESQAFDQVCTAALEATQGRDKELTGLAHPCAAPPDTSPKEVTQEPVNLGAETSASPGAPADLKSKGNSQQAHVRAAASYEWVCSARPDLTPNAPQKYSESQWEYVRKSGCPAYQDENGNQLPVPAFDTWTRQIRAGNADPKSPKASPRSGRKHGKSIIRPEEI